MGDTGGKRPGRAASRWKVTGYPDQLARMARAGAPPEGDRGGGKGRRRNLPEGTALGHQPHFGRRECDLHRSRQRRFRARRDHCRFRARPDFQTATGPDDRCRDGGRHCTARHRGGGRSLDCNRQPRTDLESGAIGTLVGLPGSWIRSADVAVDNRRAGRVGGRRGRSRFSRGGRGATARCPSPGHARRNTTGAASRARHDRSAKYGESPHLARTCGPRWPEPVGRRRAPASPRRPCGALRP